MTEVIRERTVSGWRIRLDLSQQLLRVALPDRGLGSGGEHEEPLSATPPMDCMVSAGELFHKAKQFDDRLLATVELAAQRGVGKLPGKGPLLTELAGDLGQTFGMVATLIHAACRLGNLPIQTPESLETTLENTLARFHADPFRSQPLGFWTWSPELSALFRQDRLLQAPIQEPGDALALATTLQANSTRWAAYCAHLDLAARLTNPLHQGDLRHRLTQPSTAASPDGWRFLPPSHSHETELIERMFGSTFIPSGFDLAEELIAQIRTGEIDLRPTQDSGWYGWLAWALVPLVLLDATPEARRVRFAGRYRDHLRDLFEAFLGLARETHIKQVRCALAGCKMTKTIYLDPGISVEPLATCYLRRAEAYRFIHGVLTDVLDASTLSDLPLVGPEGETTVRLAQGLDDMEALFRGAYAVVCDEIGLVPESRDLATDVARFQRWSRDRSNDPDLTRDARMMVPVYFDLYRKKTRVWAFLGWRPLAVEIGFQRQPQVLGCQWVGEDDKVNHRPPQTPDVSFRRVYGTVASPVFSELSVGRVLDRDEFQSLCDQHQTAAAIRKHLS